MVWKNQAQGQRPKARAVLCQENANPILEDLEDWLQAQLPKVSCNSPLAKAIRYALNFLSKTRAYLDNGFWGWTTTTQSAP